MDLKGKIVSDKITALTIKNAPKGNLRVETGLRYKSNGNGTGNWQGRYMVHGRQVVMSLGIYPEVSLKDARDVNYDNRAMIRRGINPKAELERTIAREAEKAVTFGDIAKLAYADLKPTWKNGGVRNGFWPKMEKYVLPEIGTKLASEITGKVLADLVRPMWHDKHATANKILIHCSQILGWAEACEYDCDGFAVKRARKILGKTRYKTTNSASLDFKALPDFYASLTNTMQDLGLKFYILTLPRTNNVVSLRWEDITDGVWAIKAEDMKRDAEHHIPLSDAALNVLDEAAKYVDEREGYVFVNSTSWKTGHISSNNWTQQMRRHGLDATAHGMRATFKMWATLNSVATDTIIEEVLHHKVRGAVEMAYMRGHTAELRRPIMQKWAGFVTGEQSQVIPFVRSPKTVSA